MVIPLCIYLSLSRSLFLSVSPLSLSISVCMSVVLSLFPCPDFLVDLFYLLSSFLYHYLSGVCACVCMPCFLIECEVLSPCNASSYTGIVSCQMASDWIQPILLLAGDNGHQEHIEKAYM